MSNSSLNVFVTASLRLKLFSQYQGQIFVQNLSHLWGA